MRVKTSCGKKKIGAIVPSICRKSNSNVARINRPRIRPMPIKHSHVASTRIDTFGGISPKVSMSMVRVARSCAGLRPGKNFSAPNQKKTIPRLTRKSIMPKRAIQLVTLTSTRSNKVRRLPMGIALSISKLEPARWATPTGGVGASSHTCKC
jgi:hypothetical protein